MHKVLKTIKGELQRLYHKVLLYGLYIKGLNYVIYIHSYLNVFPNALVNFSPTSFLLILITIFLCLLMVQSLNSTESSFFIPYLNINFSSNFHPSQLNVAL